MCDRHRPIYFQADGTGCALRDESTSSAELIAGGPAVLTGEPSLINYLEAVNAFALTSEADALTGHAAAASMCENVEHAAEYGVSIIIEPGGSSRTGENVQAAVRARNHARTDRPASIPPLVPWRQIKPPNRGQFGLTRPPATEWLRDPCVLPPDVFDFGIGP